MRRTTRCTWTLLIALLACAATLLAQVPPERPAGVSEKLYKHPDLTIQAQNDRIDQLPAEAAAQARARLTGLQAPENSARLDRRGGRFATLTPATPLVPGDGVGNSLSWNVKANARSEAVRSAFAAYLRGHQAELGLEASELSLRVTDYGDGTLYGIYGQREIDGIPVRGSYVSGVVSHGNLVLMGAHQWGDFNGSERPQLGADEARFEAEGYVLPLQVTHEWGKPELVYLTMGRGNGYGYKLAWSIKVNVAGDEGNYEALLDAHTGEVLSFEDTNHYAEVKGGVYPVSNDGVPPDGVEQPGWPMPYASTSLGTTDTGGNVAGSGSFTADLAGPYVNINDNCGASSLSGVDVIDFGTSGGTDCTTPTGGPTGNTHAARTGFYELNKIKEMARGQLPGNTWLQATLTSNMNINSTCNAYWNGTVNFYRSGGGCSNTGELAGVFDHEWGHGLDANDATPGIASPSGEGIADVYTALRLNNSCIGRNFRPGIQCGGYGDPCIDCTGVRDIDYLKRASGQPHDFTWRNANCGSTVHCIGYVYSEAVWNLWKRELPSVYGYDNNTAHEIVNRLTFIGAGNTGSWFSGSPPEGGCAGGSGYLNYLAADDDNGTLSDGTPHMQAIYNAFNTQEIACSTPTVQDSGCAGGPTAAPTVTSVSANMGVNLSWTSVAGATEYEVFRTEGVFACDFGKVKVAATAGTTFNDTGLQNGRDYSYVVIAKGPADSCFGPASACATQQPGKIPCSVDPDCDDGLFCNGAETCVAGFCENGTNPCAANPTWTCDEVGDVCVPECTVDADCDDGKFCNGAEVCNAGTCGGGSDPCPGQSCDESCNNCAPTTGPQNAVYDAGFGAPLCGTRGNACDSQSLVDGRANLGPEVNQPNTLDACTDGISGTYHSDESNDRVAVTSVNGRDFTEGLTVRIDATVWAWSTGSSDTADFYYAADANNPSWTYIGSVVPPAGGAHTLSVEYELPAGDLQAVRVNFRYSGSVGSCTAGGYDDRDDLVFTVGGGSCTVCTVDADCDDGLFCNGAETCVGGACQAGTPPACDDGLFCNGAETCNEGTDTCDPGTAPNCDDGVSCTDDSCNEGTDQCDNVANDANCPDNGLFCDGAEYCDVVLDCSSTGDPCAANETCNETTNACDPPVCLPTGASCTKNVDCCSNSCRGKGGSKTCQ